MVTTLTGRGGHYISVMVTIHGYHGNPPQWFNGVTTWKEAVVMVTELAGVVTILGVVFRILKICGCLGEFKTIALSCY